MTFEVEVGGRIRVVSVERAGRDGRFRVTLDGAVHVLDAVRLDDHGLSILVDGREAAVNADTPGPPQVTGSADVQICPGAAGEVLATFEGRTARAVLNGRRAGRTADGAVRVDGHAAIAAPMPGRVVRVLVEPGEEVAARQGVVVVEAMKMENELRAPRAGRVKEITVTPGTSVEAGRVLAVIE